MSWGLEAGGAVHLPDALPHALLVDCRQRLAGAHWELQTETGAAFTFHTATCALPALEAWIHDDVLEIRRRCGLPVDARFTGRLKRLVTGARFPWHRDHRKGQLLGMVINLGHAAVQGGVFEMRRRWEPEPKVRIASHPGDVHVFDVADPTWVHRVTPVASGQRVVLAGWWVH